MIHEGTTGYITENMAGKVVSFVTYDDWGARQRAYARKMVRGEWRQTIHVAGSGQPTEADGYGGNEATT